MHTAKLLVLSVAVLVSVWFAASYAAQRGDRPDTSYNSYDVVVGPQKSDMQRMIEAYERLSEQYLVVVQDNLALMANQDRQILERLAVVEKKLDLLSEKLDAAQKPAAPAKIAAAPEQSPPADVKY